MPREIADYFVDFDCYLLRLVKNCNAAALITAQFSFNRRVNMRFQL